MKQDKQQPVQFGKKSENDNITSSTDSSNTTMNGAKIFTSLGEINPASTPPTLNELSSDNLLPEDEEEEEDAESEDRSWRR